MEINLRFIETGGLDSADSTRIPPRDKFHRNGGQLLACIVLMACEWYALPVGQDQGALCEERSGRSGSPLNVRSTATFAIPTGIRIEVLAAAVAIGAVIKAILFLGRFFQPGEYFEMNTPAVSPDRSFDRSFDGDEQCIIFFLIQSRPPFRTVPWDL